MDYETILLEHREGIAYLTLNRPERANTISRQLSTDVVNALDEIAADMETRVVIVTGAGRHFCDGADLRDMGRSVTGGGNQPVSGGGRDMMSRFEEIPQPVIAAINGAAMGGGGEIALACDIRIMSTSAQIGVPEIRFGALPAGGGTARLPRIVGMGKAKELIYSSLPISAEEAERIGLVNKAVPPEELMATAEAMARGLRDFGRQVPAQPGAGCGHDHGPRAGAAYHRHDGEPGRARCRPRSGSGNAGNLRQHLRQDHAGGELRYGRPRSFGVRPAASLPRERHRGGIDRSAWSAGAAPTPDADLGGERAHRSSRR